MTPTLVRACSVLALVAAAARGQEPVLPPELDSGAIVRVMTRGTSQSRLEGRVIQHDSATLTFAMTKAGSAVTLPWSNVVTFDWRRGTDHARGARDGAVFGLLLGALILGNKYGDVSRDYPDDEVRRDAIVLLGAFPAATTLIGFARGTHRWNRVPVPGPKGGTVRLEFRPEDEVRMLSTLGTVTGRNAVATADSMRVTVSTGPVSFPWRRVGDLQMSFGRRRVLGTVVGAAGAFLVTTLGESFWDMTTSTRLGISAVGGAAGWRVAPRRWVSIPMPRP
jgi:hypothetical protein